MSIANARCFSQEGSDRTGEFKMQLDDDSFDPLSRGGFVESVDYEDRYELYRVDASLTPRIAIDYDSKIFVQPDMPDTILAIDALYHRLGDGDNTDSLYTKRALDFYKQQKLTALGHVPEIGMPELTIDEKNIVYNSIRSLGVARCRENSSGRMSDPTPLHCIQLLTSALMLTDEKRSYKDPVSVEDALRSEYDPAGIRTTEDIFPSNITNESEEPESGFAVGAAEKGDSTKRKMSDSSVYLIFKGMIDYLRRTDTGQLNKIEGLTDAERDKFVSLSSQNPR